MKTKFNHKNNLKKIKLSITNLVKKTYWVLFVAQLDEKHLEEMKHKGFELRARSGFGQHHL